MQLSNLVSGIAEHRETKILAVSRSSHRTHLIVPHEPCTEKTGYDRREAGLSITIFRSRVPTQGISQTAQRCLHSRRIQSRELGVTTACASHRLERVRPPDRPSFHLFFNRCYTTGLYARLLPHGLSPALPKQTRAKHECAPSGAGKLTNGAFCF